MKKQKENIDFMEEIKRFFNSILNGSFVNLKKEEERFRKKIYKNGKRFNKKQLDLIKDFVEKSKTVETKNKINFIRSLKTVVYKIPAEKEDFIQKNTPMQSIGVFF